MMAIAFLSVRMLGDCFKSRQRLEAEILVLRHQLNVLQQRALRRVHLHWASRVSSRTFGADAGAAYTRAIMNNVGGPDDDGPMRLWPHLLAH